MDSPTRRREANRKRRHRERLQLAADLVTELGPDRAKVIYLYSDGWSVRAVTRLQDQKREGHLLSNCLRKLRTPMPNLYSLRDEDGVPHVCFSGWRRMRRDYESRLDRMSQIKIGIAFSKPLLCGRYAILFAEARGGTFNVPDPYLERLYEFAADRPVTRQLAPLPPTLRLLCTHIIAATMGAPIDEMAEQVQANVEALRRGPPRAGVA